MATAAKKPPRKKSTVVEAYGGRQHDLADFVRTAMKRYGTETNENRSVPCYFDGLKPVARKLLYAGSEVAMTQTKTARLVGHVIGIYHPHGDTSTADAATTMVTCPTPTFDGFGNWGSLLDEAAAMRYSELRVSNYGQQFLEKDYLAVTPMTPNYDDKTTEPVFLPALLPNILLNPQFGIGLSITTDIPAFTPDSLLPVCADLLRGKEFTGRELRRRLKFNLPWGGAPVNTKENHAAIEQLLTGSHASRVEFDTDVEVNETKRTMTIKGAAPGINIEKAVLRIRKMKFVRSVHQDSKGVVYTVTFLRTVTPSQFELLVTQVRKELRARKSYTIFVAKRTPDSKDETKFETTFHSWSVVDLLKQWLKYRLTLEHRAIKYRIGKMDALIYRLDLMIRACDYLDVIFKALRAPDPAAAIAKGMKISVEDANIILDLQVRRLSRLDQSALKKDLAERKLQLKALQRDLKDPTQPVIRYFENVARHFQADDKKIMGCHQWRLKIAKPKSEVVNTDADA